MKGTILTPNVYLRFRPGTSDAVEFTSSTSLAINGMDRRSYLFDHVFPPNSHTRQVFDVCCKTQLDACLSSANRSTLLFVYGNTGTGKTHTIGLLEKLNEGSEGLIPMSLKYVFSQTTEVSVSFYEIYMQEVFDLLSNGSKSLQIRENQKEPYIENLLEVSVGTYFEAIELINIGRQQRKVAEQKLNRNSSRSHAIFTLHINHAEGASKVCFVDLAGSERLKETEARGLNMLEAVHINSSLSSLETVLVSLGNGTQPSFRASKLTRLLQPYLLGRISIIVTSNGGNLQSLQFAKRCKGIKIVEQTEDKEAWGRIRYLEEELEKAKKSVRRDLSMTPRRGKENRRHQKDHNRSKSQHLLEDKYDVKYLLKIIAKLVTMLQTTYKSLHNICVSQSNQEVASHFLKSLQIPDLQVEKFMAEKLECLVVPIKIPPIEFSSREILESLSSGQRFTQKIKEVGVGIIDLGSHLSNSRCFIQELCTSELKCHLWQKKCRQGEDGIRYLTSRIDKRLLREVEQCLKTIGVRVESKRKSFIRIEEE